LPNIWYKKDEQRGGGQNGDRGTKSERLSMSEAERFGVGKKCMVQKNINVGNVGTR
jgi:hypothetical protein